MGTRIGADNTADAEFWLSELRRRHWWFHYFGEDRSRPVEIAAVRMWPTCADVVILRGEHDAIAYRAPLARDGSTDPLTPEWVTWVYGSSAVWAIRAVLTYEKPGEERGPIRLMAAPPECGVSGEFRRPVTIRPPMGADLRSGVIDTPQRGRLALGESVR